YSLFMVSRFREELRHHSVEIAIERMMGSVGRAVAVSGVAVAIGLSSLTVFEASALRSMGYAGVITVVSTLVFGLTVLPAMLAMLGPRVNRLRVPLPRRLRLIEDDSAAADRRQGHGVWAWIAARVMRRPLLIAGPVLALLLLAGSPFLSLRLSTGSNLSDLPDTRLISRGVRRAAGCAGEPAPRAGSRSRHVPEVIHRRRHDADASLLRRRPGFERRSRHGRQGARHPGAGWGTSAHRRAAVAI